MWRGEHCQRLERSNSVTPISSMPTENLLPGSRSTDAAVNLLHMKLFYHFQTYTCQTLLFTPEVWGHALQLCFQYEFLMNATLSVAARHLAFLQPEDATYPTAASSHLCRALSGFRKALSKKFPWTHIDAFIATLVLLQHEVWTSPDVFSLQDDGMVSFDPSKDGIFAFCSSLKQVFVKSVRLAPH